MSNKRRQYKYIYLIQYNMKNEEQRLTEIFIFYTGMCSVIYTSGSTVPG